MAAIFPSRPRNLCGGGPAFKAGVTDPGYSGACARRFGKRRRVDLQYNRFGRFSAHLDFYWIGCDLGLFGIFPTQFRFSIVDARRDASGKSASLISAYSIIGGAGAVIMPTLIVDGDALAPFIIACWRVFTLRCCVGGHRNS